MNTGIFGEGFPYSNFHDLNMDWIIKIAKDFLDQYTHIQDIIAQGEEDITTLSEEKLEALQTKATELEGLLQAWYNTHSQDIANQLTQALSTLSTALSTSMTAFTQHAEEKATDTLSSIPADYTTLANDVAIIDSAIKGKNIVPALPMEFGFIQSSDGAIYEGGTTYKYSELIPVKPGNVFFYSLYGSTSTIIIGAYETSDGDAVIAKSVQGTTSQKTSIYIVPTGVNYIRITRNINENASLFFMIGNDTFIPFTAGDFNDIGSNVNPYAVLTGDNFTNAPTKKAGTLYCYEDYLYNLKYQVFIRTIDACVFTRIKTSNGWGEWKSTADAIGETSVKIAGKNLVNLANMSWGFVQSSNGQLFIGGDTYKYSELIPVYEGETYEFTLMGSTSTLLIAGYEDDNSDAVISKSYAGNTVNGQTEIISKTYTVPTGIKYIRITTSKYVLPEPQFIWKPQTPKTKEISILFVGNSLTQDGIAYLPYLLKNYYPDIPFRFYIYYNGGCDLDQQYTKFTNDSDAEIFSYAENSIRWTNLTNSISMSEILNTYKFDIVCMQEYFNGKTSFDVADLDGWNNCQTYIQSHYTGGNPLEFISLFHAPKRDDATTVFNLTKHGNELILKNTIAQDMIPMGIAIYRAMSTSLDSLGDVGHLSNDGTHAQEGLPCLMQTYSVLCWLFNKLGIMKSIYSFPFKMTTAIYDTIGVPGPNVGTGVIEGTTEQNLLCQEVAIKAFKEGQQFTIYNLSDNN